jgi:flagellar biosynthesis anti-sigma factor FlgM
MRIHDAYRHSLHGAGETAKPPTDKDKGAPVVEVDRRAEGGAVSLSDRAKELAAAMAQRAEKIEKLRASIRDGRYAVDPRIIAQKLVGDDE